MKNFKAFFGVMLVLLIGVCSFTVSKAYFDRGTVGVSAGRSSVTLEEGKTETVSVSFSPSQSSQLPGCGMAECPQSCGEKECLDENGECTCNGKTYQTYYAFASVSSSNTSVATAEYSDGSVTVRGISPGTATITVTASLRQFSSSSTTIKVTVTKKAVETQAPTQETTKTPSQESTQAATKESTQAATKAPSQSSGSSSESSSSGNGSSGSISAVQITGQTTGKQNDSAAADGTTKEDAEKQESNEGESSADTESEAVSEGGSEIAVNDSTSEIVTIQSDRGPITFVPITAGKIGQEQLESILGEKAYVDFQMKDAAGTVLYAWEFCGTDLRQAENLDLIIEMGTAPFEGCNYGTASNSIYLSYGHEGELPGKASVFIKVSEWFTDEKTLNLYSYADGHIERIQENITIENGYATLTLDSCSNMILSTEKWEEQAADENGESRDHNLLSIAVAAVIVIIAAAAGAVIWMRRKKGGRQ